MGRQRWGSRLIFLFAAIGSAIGLGNVWRFPYLVGKYGGGAFLIPYLIILLALGIPLLILEFALGQKMQSAAIDAYKKISGKWTGVGLVAVLGAFLLVCYYAVIMGWSMLYFFKSFATDLPWAGGSNEFFFNSILQISDGAGQMGGVVVPIALALFFSWVLIYFSVWKGVKSVGKVVMVTMPLPILLILVLVINGLTLEGSMAGILFYLKPNFAALLDPAVWNTAIGQIFFTLSVGFGVMIAYASFKKEKSDITKNAVLTAIINCGLSLVAGFAVFTTLGHMAFKQGVPVEELATAGPGLAFVVFPEALSLLPGAPFFAVIFFLALLSLAIDSAFSLVEGVSAAIRDKFKNTTIPIAAFYVSLVAFVIGILFATRAGLYYLDITDHFLSNYVLVLSGLLGTIAVGWGYGVGKIRKYINEVSEWKLGSWFDSLVKYVIPAILIYLVVATFIQDLRVPYEGYPAWALWTFGWGVLIVFIVIGVFASITAKKETTA